MCVVSGAKTELYGLGVGPERPLHNLEGYNAMGRRGGGTGRHIISGRQPDTRVRDWRPDRPYERSKGTSLVTAGAGDSVAPSPLLDNTRSGLRDWQILESPGHSDAVWLWQW